MTTVDHPLLEANRALESGFLDPDALKRAADDWHSGPQTAARLRESIFEVLGQGWRGCVPVAIEAVLDPETVRAAMDIEFDRWLAIGVIDDSSVLELAGGEWFGGVDKPGPEADRPMVGIVVSPEDAAQLDAMLNEDREPVWAVPALDLLPLGGEHEYRAFMAGGEPDIPA